MRKQTKIYLALWILGAVLGCIAMVPSLVTGRFQRWQGGVLLLSYVVYLVITCSGAAL